MYTGRRTIYASEFGDLAYSRASSVDASDFVLLQPGEAGMNVRYEVLEVLFEYRRQMPSLPYRIEHLKNVTVRVRRASSMVSALAVLLASAIGLQYAPEDAHAWLSATHWVLGLVLAAGLLWHWIARLRR